MKVWRYCVSLNYLANIITAKTSAHCQYFLWGQNDDYISIQRWQYNILGVVILKSLLTEKKYLHLWFVFLPITSFLIRNETLFP